MHHSINLKQLEMAGFKTRVSLKRSEPDLVWVEPYRAWMPIDLAVRNGFVIPPKEPAEITPSITREEVQAKAALLQPNHFKHSFFESTANDYL